MKTPEQKFWDKIKDHCPGETDRVENYVCDGMPDVSGSWEGHDYWLELKVSGNKEKICDPSSLCRPSQRVWHYKRFRQGAKVFVAVEYPFAVILYRCISFKQYKQIAYAVKGKADNYWILFERNFQAAIKGELL